MSSDARRAVTDREILGAVVTALRDGERDLLGGGVPVSEIADRTGLTETHAKDRVRDLHDSGDLVRVWGASPEPPYAPRPSYLKPSQIEDGRPTLRK